MGPYGLQPGPGPNPDWAPTRARAAVVIPGSVIPRLWSYRAAVVIPRLWLCRFPVVIPGSVTRWFDTM